MMRFLLSVLVVFAVASPAESLVSPGRRAIFDAGQSSSRSKTTAATTTRTSNARSSSMSPLRDVVNGSPQWYAGASSAAPSMGSYGTPGSQSELDRKVRDAAKRFVQFQSGYFSPMMPNENMVNNGMPNNLNYMSNNNNGYYNDNGYDSNGYGRGYNNRYDPNDPGNILAEDFVFRSPTIGPINKWDYIESVDYFRIYDAFPDISPNCYGFAVDLVDPLKVRFFVKASGTYQNKLGGFPGTAAAQLSPPDGRQYIGSTEAWSVTFNDYDRMQVKYLTAGYVVDRFEDQDDIPCTTDGKGLVYGILNTIGAGFFPSEVGDPSLQLGQWLTDTLAKNGVTGNSFFPKSVSDPNAIPQWWGGKRLSGKR